MRARSFDASISDRKATPLWGQLSCDGPDDRLVGVGPFDLDVALVLCCVNPVAHGGGLPDRIFHAPYWCASSTETMQCSPLGGLLPACRS